jgi:nitrogen-specific signal transduction histidine kinase
MKSLLLVTETRAQLSQLHDLLATAYTLYSATGWDEALEFLQLTRVDVVLAAYEHRAEPVSTLFARARTLQPQCVTLCLVPATAESVDHDVPPSDFILRPPFGAADLHQALKQAMEKQQLVEEIAALRAAGNGLPLPATVPHPGGGEISLTRIGQILRHFAQAFGTNFDLSQSLHLFLEAVDDFLRPSRLSILVWNATARVFEMRAQRGLPPKIAEQLRLRADEGLPHWLMSEARLVQRSEVESQLHLAAYREIGREMQALKAVVSIPLLAAGSLVGIVNLGERVTGVPYSADELEILCSLARQAAMGIQDSALYQTIQTQKLFTEKILRYMSSGVISIDQEEKIRLCNHRAAQILGTTWADMVHQDLRSLPSPLGDLLYETLCDGKTYNNYEVVLAAGKVPLEINTYQILDEHDKVAGSVMVFDDLTFQKLLYEERRRADQLDFLNKVVGRMAHEIKNPLVSIQTFIELLGEHNDDPEFRDQFRAIVRRDVRTIDGITEKLVSFASKIVYRFEYGDIQALLQRLVSVLSAEQPAGPRTGEEAPAAMTAGIELTTPERVTVVKFDPEQLSKALRYLVIFLQQDLGACGRLSVTSAVRQPGPRAEEGDWVYIGLTGKGRKLQGQELERLFDPFCMDQSTLVDVGPCVSQRIIEEHGGHLEVRQEKNGDTTFVIALPVAAAVEEATTSWTAASVF